MWIMISGLLLRVVLTLWTYWYHNTFTLFSWINCGYYCYYCIVFCIVT